MRRLWHDHSLTICLTLLGVGLGLVCVWLPEGKSFDAVLGLAHGCWTAGLINVLSGWLRERNKPED